VVWPLPEHTAGLYGASAESLLFLIARSGSSHQIFHRLVKMPFHHGIFHFKGGEGTETSEPMGPESPHGFGVL
jgi:hypothetical protein